LRHLQRGWSFLRPEMNEFLDLLPAQQRVNETDWYRGTADAVYQNLDIIRGYNPEYIVVLAGDHIYKMDYSLMLLDHVERGSGCTVGCIEVPRMEAVAFGVMAVDSKRRVIDFVEKPPQPPGMPDNPDIALASMGIYVFNADYLYRLLEEDIANPKSNHDFGKDIIPRVVRDGSATAHPFSMSSIPPAASTEHISYWRDVGTVDAFWSANLDLTSAKPELDLYDKDWPIWTNQEQLPPAKFLPDENGVNGRSVNVMVSGGCIVHGSDIDTAVLFSSVQVESGCTIREAVILPQTRIGKGCRLSKVVIDRGCLIPDGMVIGEDPLLDEQRFFRTESGVVLVTSDMLATRPNDAPTA
jgi:glucose-1-phosphate adenylyltransferase